MNISTYKRNIYIYTQLALCSCGLVAASSCTDEDYKVYDTTQKDSVFFEYKDEDGVLADKIDYEFNFELANVHTVEIPVTLMGVPKDYDRTISIVQVTEQSGSQEEADGEQALKPMVEGINYTITDNVIRANEVGGVVCVNLLRDNDPEIRSEEKVLTIVIGENDDLRSVGENKITITYSDIRPEIRPSWWDYSCLPSYSFEAAQLFFYYFYLKAPEADINLYNEMIDRYGDYFVNAQYFMGPFAMYDRFLRNYVLIPMYREHPELEWVNSPEW